jgi:hypothetical protein
MTSVTTNPVSLRDTLIQEFHQAAIDAHSSLKEKIDIIHNVMKNILTRGPAMKEYFDRNSLNAKGITYILQRKFPGGIPIEVCEYIEDFEEKVERLKPQETFCTSFIVRGTCKNPECYLYQYNHFTHICLERKEGRTRIFVTESTKAIQQSLYIMNTKWKCFPDAEVYFLNISRQFDQYTCPIFALKDAILLARHPELCEKLAQYSSCEFSVHYSTLPPPALMKCAQSTKVLTAYLPQAKSTYPEEEITSLEEKLRKHQMILERTLTEPPKPANGRAFHFLCKYIEIILREKLPE